MPGCPPPVENALTGARVGGVPASGSTFCAYRDPNLASAVLNNVAVPLAFSFDPALPTSPTQQGNPLQILILGGKDLVERAIEAKATFVTFWIGNNDVLAPASVGTFEPIAGASPGVIPPDTIDKYIDLAVDQLVATPTLKGGVLIGVVRVINAPRFFPATALFTATGGYSDFKANIDAGTGKHVIVLPNCVNSPALISSILVERIRAGSYAPIISCEPLPLQVTRLLGIPDALAEQLKLGDLFVLSPQEAGTLDAIVTAVNAHVAQKAQSIGWAYWDPNGALAQLKASGAIPPLPDFTSATAPYGTYMSLDGVHPRKPTHVLAANALVGVINAKYGTSLPTIPTP
jgi:hypothetical protein